MHLAYCCFNIDENKSEQVLFPSKSPKRDNIYKFGYVYICYNYVHACLILTFPLVTS